ncbi:beta-N-acetylhexosaminidase [Rhodovibrio sodomensis]|uniref:beta-N-acetylhexosaminidase n=1 Tax=Rhodovibrio sodomensis TaxID=1088 RepID=A0ABS1DEH6_9PROT|nr:beta-N-acetylhexosaminidase [Rhodovibrio sodomensis]MBK1668346.1 beta-N-acetylhexosaminidase [Rhodovibrio sodomensis]
MPRRAILGCAGPQLTRDERRFFAEQDPLGFILFARNCENPEQVRALVDQLRDSVGRADAPVLIDQEGGRVQRLKPPTWRHAPAPGRFAELAERDLDAAREAAQLNARLLAHELGELGITVDCVPCLDIRVPGASEVIGDRSFGADPGLIAALGKAVVDGLLTGGVLPTIKHVPGHGRALVDSHHELPRVAADLATLRASDFRPFAELVGAYWAMTAHVIYTAIDPDRPATLSPSVIGETIRDEIGFDGVLISDDLSMQALSGGFAERAAGSLAAGCDLVLHCNGAREEMAAVMAGTGALDGETMRRVQMGERARRAWARPLDAEAARRQLDALLAGA